MAQPAQDPPDLNGDSHPSRLFQERVLADPGDQAAWRGLHTTYEGMADSWRDWTDEQPGYDLPVREGLGRVKPADLAVEICCGTGDATGAVAERAPRVIACDLSAAMLRRRVDVPGVLWMVADVRSLPLASKEVPLLVSLNGVFHPEEINRVIKPGGQLLWCTSFRAGTPLYVAPHRVQCLLGPGWSAEGAPAGHGEWTLFTAPGL